MVERIIKARWIFPISKPPIEGGWVHVRGHEILAVGNDELPTGDVDIKDLGDTAVLPGLVNAHTHLEFSDLQEPIGFPGISLSKWVGAVMERRRRRRRDPGRAVMNGLNESHRHGTRLVGEIATTPWAGFRYSSPLEVVAFAETIGLTKERSGERLATASSHLAKADVTDKLAGGISPHAPYSTLPSAVDKCVELSVKHQVPLAMHVAESWEERQLLEFGTGPFADRLQELGFETDGLFPQGTDATRQLLETLAEAPSALIVHGNDLNEAELSFIASRDNLTVVYCPRTHAFFGHSQKHPFEQLLAEERPVALGTDSRASNPDLSIWNEVRWLLANRPEIPWHEVLAMATMYGADALMRPDLGRIEPGANAGLLAVDGRGETPETLVSRWIEASSPRWLTEECESLKSARSSRSRRAR